MGLEGENISLEPAEVLPGEASYRIQGVFATKMAAPKAVAAVPRTLSHIISQPERREERESPHPF